MSNSDLSGGSNHNSEKKVMEVGFKKQIEEFMDMYPALEHNFIVETMISNSKF